MSDDSLRRSYENILGTSRADSVRANCLSPEQLMELVEMRTSEAQRLIWMRHVMSCEQCLREFEMLRSLRSGMTVLQRRRVWRRAAVATAVAVGAVSLGLWLTRARGSADVRLLPPFGSGTLDAPLRLRWHAVAGSTQYLVEIWHDGAQVYATTTSDTTVAVPSTVRLQTGTPYTWLVRAGMPAGGTRTSRREEFTLGAP